MYDDLEARLHDVFWAAAGRAAELGLLETFLELFPGTALELGCGSGRLLLPLLEKGFFIEGLDNAADMLRLCRERSGALEPMLHQGDIGDFQTGATYSAITIPAFTLQFIPAEKLDDVFSNIRNHLHPGGGLYFTTFIPWAEIVGELEENTWFLDQETSLADGNLARCHTRFEIQRLSQCLTREHRYEIVSADDDVLETSSSSHHLTWLWPNELTRLLHDAGFCVDRIIGDFNADTPCDDNSQIVTFFCTSTAQ